VLDSVSRLPHLFPQLEEILFPIMQAMCSEEGQDVFEEILEMISYFTYFSPEVSSNRLLDFAHCAAHCMLCGPHIKLTLQVLTRLCCPKQCMLQVTSSKGPSCMLVFLLYEALLYCPS